MSERVSRKWWIVAALCGFMVAILGLFGCSSGSQSSAQYKSVEKGKLIVAASLDFPPFESLKEGTNDAEGFSVDLMNAIGEKMGVKVEFSNQNFDTILGAVAAGTNADIGVSSITVDEERKQTVDFTDVYYISNQGIAVMKGSEITADNYQTALAEATIAVQSGTTGQDLAEETFPNATITPMTAMTEAFAALQSGRAQAVFADLPVIQEYVSKSYQDATVIAEIPTGEEYGIAVSKDNPELTKALNAALADVLKDGTYAKLYEKWFGMPAPDTMLKELTSSQSK